jgi:hypothetical protein
MLKLEGLSIAEGREGNFINYLCYVEIGGSEHCRGGESNFINVAYKIF